jgi:hypothetical protein
MRVTSHKCSLNLAPGTPDSAYGDLVTETRAGDALRDDELEDEIALVGELVIAATSSDAPLSLDQIDRALGLR